MTNAILFTARQAQEITGGTLKGRTDWQVSSISNDTRTLQKEALYVALRGELYDGHAFCMQALQQGAAALLVEQVPADVPSDTPCLVVPDALKALEHLAQAERGGSQSARVIAVTGSVGKTSTKEMLLTVLARQGQTYGSRKSFNNHIGVPLTVANMPRGTDYGVFEIGMNHTGEIAALVPLVRPDVVVITNITPVHIGNFENGLDGIAAAKAEIFNSTPNIAIIPHDSAYAGFLRDAAQKHGCQKVLTFGEGEGADARLLEVTQARNGTMVKASICGEDISFRLRLRGQHQAINAVAVLLAVWAVGGNVQTAAEDLWQLTPLPGRGETITLPTDQPDNPITLIDETYNASPASMCAAFKVLALIDPGRGGRRIAILGDMLELGEDAPRLHKDLALPLRAANVDLVYTCGKMMRQLHDVLPANQRGEHRENSKELAKIIPEVLSPGDVVMVKGSHGSAMNVVVEALRTISYACGKDKTHAL